MRKFLRLFSFLIFVCLSACVPSFAETPINYRQEMRQFVGEISSYAHSLDPDFLVIPQNGQELLVQGDDVNSEADRAYIASIDGIGREDLFYGFEADDLATDPTVTSLWIAYLDLARQNGLAVLVIDYCSTPEKTDTSYQRNHELGFLSLAADRRELDRIPSYPPGLFSENDDTIETLGQAQNFLYLINPARYSSKEDFIRAVTATNYDLLIMDLYLGDEAFTRDEVEQLRHKTNGGSRLVLCYMSIGEAEAYRPYWKAEWDSNPPEWLLEENPNWAGNYRVQYWNEEWKALITGSADSYVGKIIHSGFDGVYLDLIDAFSELEDEASLDNE